MRTSDKEIERKFLVRKDLWYGVQKPAGLFVRQGYLVSDPDKTIRIRVTDTGAFLTIKGSVKNYSRDEYEFPIPVEQGTKILEQFTTKRVEKIRYVLRYKEKTWEVDEFLGDNEGLIMAEIELSDENEEFSHPQWLGDEVTHDLRYYNANLAINPYKNW